MKLRRISLRTAVMIPLLIIIILIITIIALLLRNDYKYLANEQGTRMLKTINKLSIEKLKNLMSEPIKVNKMAAQYIMDQELYEKEDLIEIEAYYRKLAKQLYLDVPQINYYGYGDEQKRFVAMRVTGTGTDNLVLCNEQTKGNVFIYEGDNRNTKVITKLPGYDPTVRPWYSALKLNNTVRWSSIYVNYDDRMDAIVTSMLPIYNKKGEFKGATCFDIRLTGISELLREEDYMGTGTIYVVDNSWRLLALSNNDEVMRLTSTNPPTGELIKSSESSDKLVNQTTSYFQHNRYGFDKPTQIKIAGANYFIMISKLKEPFGLDWMTVAVIPEESLMSYVKERQATLIWIVSIIGIITCIFGLAMLNKVISPILRSSRVATAIANGKWDTKLELGKGPIKESQEFANAFNSMIESLEKSFKEIKLSEEKYKTLVENLENMIFSISPEGEFISINSSFEKNLGISRNAAIGKKFIDVFTTEQTKRFWKQKLEELLEKKEKLVTQYEFTNSFNKRRVLLATLIPVLKSNGEIEMILGSDIDITSLIEAEEEIKKLHDEEKERLEVIVQEKTEELKDVMKELMDKEKLASLGSIVSGIAHEINTPLGVAVSAASYMETTNNENIKLIEEGRFSRTSFNKYIEAMEETATILNTNLSRAAELVKSFKLIAVNQSVEVKTYFNMLDYIKNVLISLKHEYKNTNVRFSIECPENLVLNSYSGDYSQIFTNFIMNSLIHGLKGKDNGVITIRIVEKEENIIITYYDNGNGITPENQKRVFEPFFTTNRSDGGSGLGLSVVYNIVTGHLGGKIACYSKIDEGTTFIIEIPKEWGTENEQ